MIIIISIIISIFILYKGGKYLYEMYKEDLEQINQDLHELKKFKREMESNNVVNLKLLQWLYDELERKNIISIEESKDEKR